MRTARNAGNAPRCMMLAYIPFSRILPLEYIADMQDANLTRISCILAGLMQYALHIMHFHGRRALCAGIEKYKIIFIHTKYVPDISVADSLTRFQSPVT